MKFKPDKNQIRWGITIFLTAAAIMLLYHLLFNGGSLAEGIKSFIGTMMSVIYGIVIAYMLSPVLHFVEKRFFWPHYQKKGKDLHETTLYVKERKHVRRCSVFISMVFFIIVLALLLMVIIPQLIKSVSSIIVSFPTYVQNIANLTSRYLADNPDVAGTINEYIERASSWLTDFTNNTLIPSMTSLIRKLSQSVVVFVRGVFNFVIGMIIAVYLLFSKEQYKAGAKKLIYAFFKQDTANELIAGARYAHYTFSGFVVGKILDSLIMGVLCYIGALILRTPYPVLMAVIVGVTNIVPFFGPYIGEVVTFALLLLMDPKAALVFLIFLLILQQIDGNIIGPKILGNSTGLSSFWVIFSVLFFGSMFGLLGWILGVPVFAIFYAFVARQANKMLEKKGLPVDADIYGDTAYVVNGEPVAKKDADWDLYQVRHPRSIWKRIFTRK